MIRSLKIKIPKFNTGQSIIFYMILYVFVMLFVQSISVPHSIVFLLDFMNMLLLIKLILNSKLLEGGKLPLVKWQSLVFLLGILVALYNKVSILLIFWGIRNQVRFIVFFIACVVFLKSYGICKIISMLKVLYFINFFISLFQFLILGLNEDALGGVFGTLSGCNGYSNIFLIMMVTIFMFEWLYNRLDIYHMMTYVAMAVLLAGLAEIKVFFVELLIVMSIIFCKIYFIDRKKSKMQNFIAIICCVMVLLIIGIALVGYISPELKDFFKLDKMWDILTSDKGYSSDGKSINRLNAFRIINTNIFHSWKDRLLGVGLGGAEYSQSLDMFNSSFYKQYIDLKYKNFTVSWLYIENGYIGFAGYVLSFVLTFRDGLRTYKLAQNDDSKILIATGLVMIILCAILIIYSAALRIDSGYLIYFFISLVYVGLRCEGRHDENSISG